MKTSTFLKKQALWFALLVASSFSFAQVTVSTFAGSTPGYLDGTGTAAQFYYPFGVATDASGNVYVADYYNSKIRKITAAGVVTTLAGSTGGYADGIGTAAKFYYPYGIAVDAGGNVYVADYGNNRIRKITPTGVVTTLAGSAQGYADGIGTAAQFSYPTGVAVDTSGNVFVADTFNNKIRKISSAGVVTTVAGSTQGYIDGTGTLAQFYNPTGIEVDASGNLYVADYANHKIRKVTPAGVVTTLAGSIAGYTDGAGTAAQFNAPAGVALDTSGNVYVADTNNNKIRKISSTGLVTTLAGSTQGYADGIGTAAQFNIPAEVAVDPSGIMYITDYSNHKIRKITGAFLSTASHNTLKDLKAYPNPSNGIFVIQTDGNAAVEVFDPTGKQIFSQKVNGQNSTIDLSQYPAGIYLAKVTTDKKQSKTVKLVKK
ncbi:MAG: T9SS type A sorting domain-containing protein [Weeksellaceae bacterium]|nr:T9SS type A sorting domain-containing protein [Weeksellaceae bacterium]